MKNFLEQMRERVAEWFLRQSMFVQYFIGTLIGLILLFIVVAGPITSVVFGFKHGWPWFLTLFVTIPLSAAIIGVVHDETN